MIDIKMTIFKKRIKDDRVELYEKFYKVSRAGSLDELADIVKTFEVNGKLVTEKHEFDMNRHVKKIRNYTMSFREHNKITREYGIRAQAMMIVFYENEKYKQEKREGYR